MQTITDRPDFSVIPPPPDHPFDTWLAVVSGDATTDFFTFVTAYAQCFDNPPLRP
ncbi:MAG TPA: hypothetical protein VJ583_06000 [Nitrososphaeraceae archaeon]|nr:hypothetical protein [Nitrososphaeraceae archaeon]